MRRGARISFSTVTLVLAVLALVADGLVAVALLLAVGSRLSAMVARPAAVARDLVAPAALAAAWVVAVIATTGSLYFSEVQHLVPCRLCWYQRIAMYPLTLLLAIAAGSRDGRARRYAAPLAGAGAVIALYHYQLERFPSQSAIACSIDAPCSVPLVNRFGFVSIPYMALSAFLLIIVLVLTARAEEPWSDEETAATG